MLYINGKQLEVKNIEVPLNTKKHEMLSCSKVCIILEYNLTKTEFVIFTIKFMPKNSTFIQQIFLEQLLYDRHSVFYW